jgi:hypothetical protein
VSPASGCAYFLGSSISTYPELSGPFLTNPDHEPLLLGHPYRSSRGARSHQSINPLILRNALFIGMFVQKAAI